MAGIKITHGGKPDGKVSNNVSLGAPAYIDRELDIFLFPFDITSMRDTGKKSCVKQFGQRSQDFDRGGGGGGACMFTHSCRAYRLLTTQGGEAGERMDPESPLPRVCTTGFE